MGKIKPFKLHPDVKLERNIRSISGAEFWDHSILTDELYKTKFVSHIETQETLAGKILAGTVIDLKEPVEKAERLTGVYKFSDLCEKATLGFIKPWIPMTMALGLNRRAQMCITLQVAHSVISLAKLKPELYEFCVQILGRNFRALGPLGSNLGLDVPKYSQDAVKHNMEAYKDIAAGNCKEAAEYAFFCCWFSYPLPADGNRSVYSAFIAASVAMAFFETEGREGPEFIRAKHRAQRQLLSIFTGAKK